MTRTGKLYRKLLDKRPLSFSEFCHLIEAFGYQHVRTSGSHRVYRHTGIAGSRVVQPRGKDAKTYQVEQFLDIIEKFGLTLGD